MSPGNLFGWICRHRAGWMIGKAVVAIRMRYGSFCVNLLENL